MENPLTATVDERDVLDDHMHRQHRGMPEVIVHTCKVVRVDDPQRLDNVAPKPGDVTRATDALSLPRELAPARPGS